MKKSIRIILWTITILVIVVAMGAIYVRFFLPNIPVKDIKVEYTKERVERGKYLANHVTVCIDCHSTRDWAKFSGPIVPGTEGKGGEIFDEKMGFPGVFVAPNITPYNLKDWTDGEIYRAITSGVNKDGHALFPVMPYGLYGKLADEDVYSIIAYIRTLNPIENQTAASKPKFPMNFILNLMPQPAQPTEIPSPSDTLNYGRYMATAAACVECHTPFEKGKLVLDKSYAGGREFAMPFGKLNSVNITPDNETGIGSWTKEMFINRFRAYATGQPGIVTVGSKDFNSIMPWNMYANMKESDLTAIYTYLKSLTPIKNKVERVVMNQE